MQTLNHLRILCASHGLHKCVPCLQIFCSAVHSSGISEKTLQVCSKAMGRNAGVCGYKVLETYVTLHSSKTFRRKFCTSSIVRKCWSCGSSCQLFFCSSCKVIQPPNENATYFELLNCDQTFAMDTQKLQRRYLELQKSLHPDNFSLKSLTEQGYSERQSSLVNKAYHTLLKPVTRAGYMLQLKGVRLEEGTDSTASPAFLLEVMKVNERLAETQSHDEVVSIGQSVREALKDLTEQINASLNKGDLQSAKELLAQMKYFSNLEEKVKDKLTESL